MVNVDVVGSQAFEACVAGMYKMEPARAHLIRPVAHREGGLGRDQYLIAPAGDCLTQDFFRHPVRVSVRGIEEIHARIEADVYQARGLGDISGSPSFEKFVAAAKGRCAEAKCRHL